MTNDVILEGQPELQSQTYHQARPGRSERPAFSVRKQNHAEVVLARLKVPRSEVADIRFGENPLECRKGSDRRHGKRLAHLRKVLHGENSALPVSEFADVV